MKQYFFNQLFPILLTVLTFFGLSILLYGFIHFLNLFPIHGKILPSLFLADILVGLTIYLKTSVDFAMLIGNLMSKNPGWKSRIAIEIGTALGNGFGTFFVLVIWTFFKEIPLLLAAMIVLASLVLLGMAEEGLKELFSYNKNLPSFVSQLTHLFYNILHRINLACAPIIRIIIPRATTQPSIKKSLLALALFAFTVPLILGLDDFAGYIPLFSIINVFGFAVGVFLGHMLLNIALFASPTHTVRLVRLPAIMLAGSIAFVGIALWGFWEVIQIISTLVLRY